MKFINSFLLASLFLFFIHLPVFSDPIDSFPFNEDFSDVEHLVEPPPPEGWSASGDDVRGSTTGTHRRTGDGAICMTKGTGDSLYSPTFDFAGYENISINFWIRGTGTSVMKMNLYYSIDGGSRVLIYDLDEWPTDGWQEHTVDDIPELDGESDVVFEWEFYDRTGGTNSIDDITIDADEDLDPTPTPFITPTPEITPTPAPSPTCVPETDLGNMLVNWDFEDWDNGDLIGWDTSAQASQSDSGEGLIGDYALHFEHSFAGPYDDDQDFSHIEKEGQSVTYYGEIWVRGLGDVRIGIRPPGTGWHSARYGDWEVLDTDEWTRITFNRTDTIDDSEGTFRIQHKRSDGETETDLFVGAAWLGEEEPPPCWPHQLPGFPEGFNCFDTGQRPEGWDFTGFTDDKVYTDPGFFGIASPAIKFDDEATTAVSTTFSNAEALYFWARGDGTDATSFLLVEEEVPAETWTTVTSVSDLPDPGTILGPIYLSPGATRLRFTYDQSAGDLAFDDVCLTRAEVTPTPVPVGRRSFSIW